MQFEIKKIGLESHGRALALLRRFFIEEGFVIPINMSDSLTKMIQSPTSAVFAACVDGEHIGVATVSSSVGLEYGRSAELDDLYIIPEARGQGIASALIETVCEWSTKLGCSTVLVTVTPLGEAQHQLIEFYQSRKFVHSGRIILERNLSH